MGGGWDGVARVCAGYGGWELVELCNGDGTETWKLLHLVMAVELQEGKGERRGATAVAGLSLVVPIIILLNIIIIIRVLVSWPSEVPFL